MTYLAHVLSSDSPKDWIAAIQDVLKLIFGPKGIPPIISKLLGFALLAAILLIGLWVALKLFAEIVTILRTTLVPLFYDRQQQQVRRNYQIFADHIEGEIRRQNTLEQWGDHRFAELEAEVEAEGIRRSRFLPMRRRGIRNEKSLSKAISASKERLILVEGSPGAGKSVALRHVARVLAQRAMHSRRVGEVIPIYVNLKEFSLPMGASPTQEDIRNFVISVINRASDRDIEEFIEEHFDEGMKNGQWLFLFDSFDEMPSILGATDGDQAVTLYATAIADFLGGMNRCRGIIASREFRGPNQLGWPVFRIKPLSRDRQFDLIDRAKLTTQQEQTLKGNLEHAPDQIQEMAGNAMFLSILCEHIKAGNPFPENVHSVFDKYIDLRLRRDSSRVLTRFGIRFEELRLVAEETAFCMLSDRSLGLSPSRASLSRSRSVLGFTLTDAQFDQGLDALEYIKLARPQGQVSDRQHRFFTFAHRRFQEYFATCIALREPDRVSADRLLTDGRWRETAVALCQMQPPEMLGSIILEAQSQLKQIVEQLTRDNLWPYPSLHILGILQEGFAARKDSLTPQIQRLLSQIIEHAWRYGSLLDRKWALQTGGCVKQNLLGTILSEALIGRSAVLEEIAYRQLAHLRTIPGNIRELIQKSLVKRALSGTSYIKRFETAVFLSRLSDSQYYFRFNAIMSWIRWIDVLVVCFAVSVTMRHTTFDSRQMGMAPAVLIAITAYLSLWLVFAPLINFLLRDLLYEPLVFRIANIAPFRFVPFLLLVPTQMIDRVLRITKPPQVHTSSGWVLALTIGLLLCWAPATLIAMIAEDSLKIHRILFAPLVGSKRGLSNLIGDRKRCEQLLLMATGVSFAGCMVFMGIRYFPHFLNTLATICVGVVPLSAFIYWMIWYLDIRSLNRWLENSSSNFTACELLAQLSRMKTSRGRAALFRDVRHRLSGRVVDKQLVALLNGLLSGKQIHVAPDETLLVAATESGMNEESLPLPKNGVVVSLRDREKYGKDELLKLVEQLHVFSVAQ